MTRGWNRTRATLVEGKRCHHCAVRVPLNCKFIIFMRKTKTAFLNLFTKQINPGSLGSWCIKETEESLIQCGFFGSFDVQITQSSIRSDEGLTLETSASESLYGGQFTLSTQLIKPNHFFTFSIAIFLYTKRSVSRGVRSPPSGRH